GVARGAAAGGARAAARHGLSDELRAEVPQAGAGDPPAGVRAGGGGQATPVVEAIDADGGQEGDEPQADTGRGCDGNSGGHRQRPTDETELPVTAWCSTSQCLEHV